MYVTLQVVQVYYRHGVINKCAVQLVLQYWRLVLVSRKLFKGLVVVSDLHWTNSGFSVKTSQNSANTVKHEHQKSVQLLMLYILFMTLRVMQPPFVTTPQFFEANCFLENCSQKLVKQKNVNF